MSLYGTFVKICVAKRSVRNENERAVNVWVRASQLAGFHYLASRSWVIFTRTTLTNFPSSSWRNCAEANKLNKKSFIWFFALVYRKDKITINLIANGHFNIVIKRFLIFRGVYDSDLIKALEAWKMLQIDTGW